jgi:hypothetical protein
MSGIKRNNPGNIRTSVGFTWKGELPGVVAPNIAEFGKLEDGYRAHIKLLSNYIKKGYDTIPAIINRWAPASDNNDPVSYAREISQRTGISATKILSAGDYDTLGKIALAMTHREHGNDIPADAVLQTYIEKAKGMLTGIVDVVKQHPLATVLILGLFIYLIRN